MRKAILAMTLMVLAGCPDAFAQGSTVPRLLERDGSNLNRLGIPKSGLF